MLFFLLFSIPLSSYITLSVVIMLLWIFFVMTKLQMDTAATTGKRATRPEPTPFTFFKPGDNPAPIIPASTLSEQELAITVNPDKGRSQRNKLTAASNPDTTPASPPQPTTSIAKPEPPQESVAPASAPVPPAEPVVATANPDFAEVDESTDYALYQPREVSVVANPPLLGIFIDAKPGEPVEPTAEQITTLKDLQQQADDKALRRKQRTEQLMKLAAGLDFEAYVQLFRTYFEQATVQQRQEPERSFYVIFAELIADESAEVQEQLLMLLEKEATDEAAEELQSVTVYTDEEVEEAEPAFT